MSTLVLKLTSNTSVRGTTTIDGKQVFSVYDFINSTCQKDLKSSYARTTLSNLISQGSEFRDEVAKNLDYLKFPGPGQRETPTMTIRGLQQLLLILGNKVAAEFRKVVEGTFTRVIAGDTSLIEEINTNAASDAPLQQAYRQALVQEPVVDDINKKRKMDREDALFDVELKERISRVKDSELARIKEFANIMTSLNPDWMSDGRLRLQVEDSLKNVVLSDKQKLIANGDGPAPSVSVSQVAQEMGIRLKQAELVAVGRRVAREYHRKHGEKPSKHKQWVDGAERSVNSYTEKDRDLIEEAIREQMGGDSDAESGF